MGHFSVWHWLIVLAVILILFGAGKLPRVMGDLAKGIKTFKAGMKEDETPEETRRLQADGSPAMPAGAASKDEAARG